MSDSGSEFLWPIRVYYEDTDSGGVVYYANYLKFMERARTEVLREYGFEQDQLKKEQGIIFAVHSLSVRYQKPAVFNDELKVVTMIKDVGKASITFGQSIFRESDNTLLCSADVKVACLQAIDFLPCAIPGNIMTLLDDFNQA